MIEEKHIEIEQLNWVPIPPTLEDGLSEQTIPKRQLKAVVAAVAGVVRVGASDDRKPVAVPSAGKEIVVEVANVVQKQADCGHRRQRPKAEVAQQHGQQNHIAEHRAFKRVKAAGGNGVHTNERWCAP